ncbi:putative quinol monooxygenase [Brachybacterium phenoliresistens]|uniref:Antibiotic biosynthesis monooxygenase n=1 Tax=Brachybacterium phenoliresistens TaxID=396014 RepID=Z9JP46_9MICO|nr:antibiotic biosynthesis monooxygenase [Brachybacterium phenoliresistens]EWS79798.1 antibiotic biosynthesis monooxygenase [Brachybacterium phenoliresistens]
MTVVVTAVFYPAEGKKEELAQAMQRGISAVHEEKGCELYAIHDAEDGTITMIEKWSTVEDLDVHGGGAAVKILNEDIDGLTTKPVLVTRMTPIPAGTDAQGLL